MRVWYEPVRSTCAPAGMANAISASATRTVRMVVPLISKPRVAGLRVPFALIRFLLEVERGDPGCLQIGRVVYRVGDDEVLVAVGFGVHVPVFGESRAIAV